MKFHHNLRLLLRPQNCSVSTTVLSTSSSSSSLLLVVATTTLFFISMIATFPTTVVEASYVYTDFFPTIDEYEETILDPDHIYGSPFGGYSRASESRIQSLPLQLPNVCVELQDYTPMYFETRDYRGRRFVCRSYHEDEIHPSSLTDSMFNQVILRNSDNDYDDDDEDEYDDDDELADDKSSTIFAASEQILLNNNNGNPGDSTSGIVAARNHDGNNNGPNVNDPNNDNNKAGGASTTNAVVPTEWKKLIAEINRRLSKLDGVCAQLHQGWWSYEWCHQSKVTQFHVHVEADATKVSDILLQDETKLGIWSQRQIKLLHTSDTDNEKDKDSDEENDDEEESEIDDDSDDDNDDGSSEEKENDNVDVGEGGTTASDETTTTTTTKTPSKTKKQGKYNHFSEGTPELAVVSDIYANGDICVETGKERMTQVDIRCCSQRVMNRIKGGILYNGKPIKSDTVAIHSLSEKSGTVCVYNITVCTPLLCGNYDDTDTTGSSSSIGGGGSENGVGSSVATTTTTTTTATDGGIDKIQVNEKEKPVLGKQVDVENMSVREILDLTFGKSHTTCIQGNTGGWWVYELCPGRYVRQFHETTMMDRISGVASTAVDTEHILGNYAKEDHETHPNDEEWKHVVNSTIGGDLFSSLLYPDASTGGGKGGNGAYYYQEYTNGDVCDHEDVTESSIKAGAVGGGHVYRACTVQYSCGNRLEMNVKEDHTCHYIVEVTVPSLCGHPLFKPPISKKQVLKCLPAEDSLGRQKYIW